MVVLHGVGLPIRRLAPGILRFAQGTSPLSAAQTGDRGQVRLTGQVNRGDTFCPSPCTCFVVQHSQLNYWQ